MHSKPEKQAVVVCCLLFVVWVTTTHLCDCISLSLPGHRGDVM